MLKPTSEPGTCTIQTRVDEPCGKFDSTAYIQTASRIHPDNINTIVMGAATDQMVWLRVGWPRFFFFTESRPIPEPIQPPAQWTKWPRSDADHTFNVEAENWWGQISTSHKPSWCTSYANTGQILPIRKIYIPFPLLLHASSKGTQSLQFIYFASCRVPKTSRPALGPNKSPSQWELSGVKAAEARNWLITVDCWC